MFNKKLFLKNKDTNNINKIIFEREIQRHKFTHMHISYTNSTIQ